jgi:hypothetical protein
MRNSETGQPPLSLNNFKCRQSSLPAKKKLELSSDSDLWQNQRSFLAWKLIVDENYEQVIEGELYGTPPLKEYVVCCPIRIIMTSILVLWN